MSKKNITISTPIAESNLKIHEKAWLDVSNFISKEDFMAMPLYWYFNYALLRVISTGVDEVKDIKLKDVFKESLVDLFASLNIKERKELFTIVLTYLERSAFGDNDKTKIYKKYIKNTSLEANPIWSSSLFFKKSLMEESLNSKQKFIYEEVEESLDLEIKKNQKDFYLMFNHLNSNNILFDFEANDIEEMLDFKTDIEKCISYSKILELELIFLKNTVVKNNLMKVQKIFEVGFESLVSSVKSKSIDLFKYDVPVNFFTLMYSFSNKEDKKEVALSLINEMFKSKNEVFYENELLKLFYALYSSNHLNEKDILSGPLPKMLSEIIDDDKRNIISLNLVYIKRASVLYSILESDISTRNKLFKNMEITNFFYYKNLNGFNMRSRSGDEARKKSMYSTYKGSLFTLDDLPEICKMFEVKPYFKIDYKKLSIINNDIYQDSEMSVKIVYKLKQSADISLIKEILFQLIVKPQEIFIESAEALIDKSKMIKDIENGELKIDRVRHKVNKF